MLRTLFATPRHSSFLALTVLIPLLSLDANALCTPDTTMSCAVTGGCSGIKTCYDGYWGPCECAVGTSFSCSTGGGLAGQRFCSAYCALSTCRAREICNGLDDDSDGFVDEGEICCSSKGDGGYGDYWTAAQQTHDFTSYNLLTSSNSYKVKLDGGPPEPNPRLSLVTDAWHNASQIWADSVMVRLDDSRYQSNMNGTHTFMYYMWDADTNAGGYCPRANTNGTDLNKELYLLDDNALAGVAYLDAADVTLEPAKRLEYLNSARAVANFLMQARPDGGHVVWDDQGGGFFWRVKVDGGTVVRDDGGVARFERPVHANALAATLFLRLFQIDGHTYYRDWGYSANAWIENLYDSNTNLYYRQMYPDGGIERTYFTDHQAAVIQAKLLMEQVTGNSSHRQRAKDIANGMLQSVVWNGSPLFLSTNDGGFPVQLPPPAGQGPIRSPAYSAWGSEGLIRVHDRESCGASSSAWLSAAQTNIDLLRTYLRDTANNGHRQSCGADGTGVWNDFQSVDQAWMQRVMAMLSRYR